MRKNCIHEKELEVYFWAENREKSYPEYYAHIQECNICREKLENLKKENEALAGSPETEDLAEISKRYIEPISDWNDIIILREEYRPPIMLNQGQLKQPG